MQIEQFESSLLSRLDALDAEFGRENERPAGPRTQGVAPMDSRSGPTQPELPTSLEAARPTVDAITRPSLDTIIKRPSLGRRASRGLARFLVVFCSGVAGALAWQSYGDVARATIANSSPQLGWLAPQTASFVPIATDVVTPAVAATPDLQQLTLGLASVRQSVDQLAAQLAAGHQQMASDIAKLQADEQKIIQKLSAAPPRPPAAPAHKPAPVTPPPSPSEQAR